MKVKINHTYKSIPEGLEFDFPDFSILTGRNGSGKSHLLEAISHKELNETSSDGKTISNILHIGYNNLNPQMDEHCEVTQVVQAARSIWEPINEVVERYKRDFSGRTVPVNIFEDFIKNYFRGNPLRDRVLKTTLNKSGKNLEDITEQDVYENMNYAEVSEGALFISQCAMIFKSYHMRLRNNQFNKFLNQDEKTNKHPVMNDDEFLNKYGPAPWSLINEILDKAGMPYEFPDPGLSNADLAYKLRLNDRSTGNEISVNDLSSGEKVLMSLALAIYNTQEEGSRPDLLLLDEPDAPLHPQYSKLLIETLTETIVKRAGVKVIMTTHSPTTVAMAPDNSVFEISRDDKTPVMKSPLEAVKILTHGIDFLRVSYEKRRQVFVESRYDVIYYENLFDAINRNKKFNYQPVFMASHNGTANCDDVISIVGKLRDSGNDLAWGIIDYDGTNTRSDSVLVLGEGQRYAIENYLLEPLYVVLALIRNRKFKFEDFGVNTRFSYTDAMNLTEGECQIIINNFLNRIGIALENTEPATLDNGFVLNYPKEFLMHQGHAYETRLKDAFNEIKSISKGNGDAALKTGLSEVIAEFPQFLPVEINDLFSIMDERS